MKYIIVAFVVIVAIVILVTRQSKKSTILPSAQTIDKALAMEPTKALIAVNGLI